MRVTLNIGETIGRILDQDELPALSKILADLGGYDLEQTPLHIQKNVDLSLFRYAGAKNDGFWIEHKPSGFTFYSALRVQFDCTNCGSVYELGEDKTGMCPGCREAIDNELFDSDIAALAHDYRGQAI